MGKFTNWLRGVKPEEKTVAAMNPEPEVEHEIMQLVGNSEETFSPINIELTLSLNVPVGFKFSQDEIIKIYFSMDYSTLKLSQETFTVPQQISFTDEEEEHLLDCQVPIGKYYARGTVFYNVVYGGAEPITFLDAAVTRGDTQYQSTTGISFADKILIDQKLGYGCPYQNVEEDFVFNVTLKPPYVLNEAGEQIPLQPVVVGNELPIGDAKIYGEYYGNEYLVSSNKPSVLYVPWDIVIENVQPIS